MKGWQIVRHSFRQVFGNIGGALRVSALLYIVQVVVGLAITASAVSLDPAQPVSLQLVLGTVLALLVVVVTSLWIAVAWHRYILLGEEGTALPAFNGALLWAYFLRSLVYGLLFVGGGVVWWMIVATALGPLMMGSMVLGFIAMALLVYLPVSVLGFRLTSALPGAAIGAYPGFFSGWQATEGKTAEIAVVALVVMVLAVALQVIGMFLIAPVPVLSILWPIITGWLQTMVGVSILTTLYGHYVQGRALV